MDVDTAKVSHRLSSSCSMLKREAIGGKNVEADGRIDNMGCLAAERKPEYPCLLEQESD